MREHRAFCPTFQWDWACNRERKGGGRKRPFSPSNQGWGQSGMQQGKVVVVRGGEKHILTALPLDGVWACNRKDEGNISRRAS